LVVKKAPIRAFACDDEDLGRGERIVGFDATDACQTCKVVRTLPEQPCIGAVCEERVVRAWKEVFRHIHRADRDI
jgi:hypothetical protein